jgi:hypothetical protein
MCLQYDVLNPGPPAGDHAGGQRWKKNIGNISLHGLRRPELICLPTTVFAHFDDNFGIFVNCF